ncbi:MAG: tetratricopeptide repeat protein, partial [Bacteroidota bacterium]|nr:tetratricopeptide repeat protein [Bacteroidota bacterium]
MKKFISLFVISFLLSTISFAQSEDVKSLHETARTFMRQGDFDNAIIVLNRALQQDKNNIELQKDLVQAYYYKRDYAKAREGIETLLYRNDADVVTFQIAGNIYKATEDVKEAERAYKKGLKKYPDSGPLYSEYGELLWAKKDYDAITQWEKGIEIDPAYSGNYYNAALFYYYTKDKVWSLLYGEIFVNMESLTERGAAMKQLLLDGYKEKLFADADLIKGEEKNKSEFAKAFLQIMNKQASLSSRGITTDALTMMRTRFILDWDQNYSSKFPFKLFDYHRQLLQAGMFEAYNQWLFGTVEN